MHSSLQNLYIQSGCLHCLLLKQFPRSGVGLSQRHVLRVDLRDRLLPEREYQQLCGVSLSLPDLLEQYYLLQLFLVQLPLQQFLPCQLPLRLLRFQQSVSGLFGCYLLPVLSQQLRVFLLRVRLLLLRQPVLPNLSFIGELPQLVESYL